MIQAYNEYTYSYWCMVWGCTMLCLPVAIGVVAVCVDWIVRKFKGKE